MAARKVPAMQAQRSGFKPLELMFCFLFFLKVCSVVHKCIPVLREEAEPGRATRLTAQQYSVVSLACLVSYGFSKQPCLQK